MKLLSRLTLVAATAMITTSLAACSVGSADSPAAVAKDCKAAHTFPTIKKGVLTVASFDVLPYAKIDGRTLKGLDGDILAEIGKLECLSVQAVNSTAAASIPMVQQGRADLTAADWYRTRERSKVVQLSEPVYSDQMGLISTEGVSKVADLKGKKVGTVDGYLWVDALRGYLGDGLKTYSSTQNLYGDLKAGRIDVVVDSVAAGSHNAGKGFKVQTAAPDPVVPVTEQPGQSNYPMKKGNTALAKAINTDIATLRKNGKLAEILKKNGIDPSAAEPGAPRLI